MPLQAMKEAASNNADLIFFPELLLYEEIDLSQSGDIRRIHPYFRLRRPEFYK
jgi:predicted amidohydrolase